MQRLIRDTLAFAGFLVILPALWVVINAAGQRTTVLWLVKDWNGHRKSGDNWSVYDQEE
jgi:hypothetical protein